MKLILDKPLAFFDLETTGLNFSKDRLLEISVIKLMPDGSTERLHQRFNPGMKISAENSAIHGIKNEDVADEPPFKEYAPKLKQFLLGCDLAGYNSNYFDVPFLAEEFIRVDVDFDFSKCKSVDVQRIFHIKEPRDLKAAYKFYCGAELENAHTAEADTEATYRILLAQLERYDDIKGDVGFLHKYTSRNNKMLDHANLIVEDSKGNAVFNFGKFKGQAILEVLKKQPGFYKWFMSGDFPEYSKKILTEIRLKEFQQR